MNQDDAFRQAISEKPDDDAPRLVYADWLEEHGDADRAEFIRVQCRLARLPPDAAERVELERRELRLLDANEGKWLGPIRREWFNRLFTDFWRRGFVERVVLRLGEFLENAPAIFGSGAVRKLNLRLGPDDGPARVEQLARCPLLERVWELSLGYGRVGDEGARALAASPHVRNLRVLHLGDCGLGAAGAAALAGSPHLAQLRRLSLGSIFAPAPSEFPNAIGARGAHAFAASGHLTALVSLDLAGNGLSVEAVRALAEGPLLARLTDLDLSGNAGGVTGLDALARSPAAGNLARLKLQQCGVGPAELQVLAASPHLTKLRALLLGENPIGVAGLRALTTSPHLPGLTALHLYACDGPGRPKGEGLGPDGLELLLASPLLDRLTELGLTAQGLRPRDVTLLADSPRVARLRRLALGSNRVGDVGLRALAA